MAANGKTPRGGTERPLGAALELKEFGTLEVSLNPEVVSYLRSRHAKHIGVAYTERAGIYRITAQSYVGRIALPGGDQLVIKPTVEVGTLFSMLCADAGLARLFPTTTRLQATSDISSYVLTVLLSEAEKLLAGGVNREYTQREADLPFIRGRINVGRQVARHADLKHRHVCAYAELSPDSPENRIVKAALLHLPGLLKMRPRGDLTRRARRLLSRLGEVTTLGRREALSLAASTIPRNTTRHYSLLLALCRITLANLSLRGREGPNIFPSFLVNMPRLFESFLTENLKARLPLYGLRIEAQRHDYLDEARRIGIRPDILVFKRGSSKPILVIDAKYRALTNPTEEGNSDLYQISAYCDRYKIDHGLLVYPQFGHSTGTLLKLRGTNKHIHIATLDLTTPSTPALDASCAALAQQVAGLAQGL